MDKNIDNDTENATEQKKRGKTSNSANTSRLKELRDKLGLTQEAFAEKVFIDKQMVSLIELGKKGLSLPLAIEIRKQFNVSLDWLYGLSDDTRDFASNILVDLKDIFDIDFGNKTIKIDNDLSEFLVKITKAYKTREEQGMPEDAFKYWINGIKNEYNEKINSYKGAVAMGSTSTTYYLQTMNEHFREKTPKQVWNQ